MKYKTKNAYRFLRNGKVMAEGTVEEVAKKMKLTEMAVYKNAERTRYSRNNGADKVVEVGMYHPIYHIVRKGVFEATGTQKELAETLSVKESTIRSYVNENRYSKVEAKYLGTKFVKLEEDEG